MSLFRKIFGRPESDAEIPEWITEADSDLRECDQRTPAGAQGVAKDRVDEIVMPMLRGKEPQLAGRYRAMLMSGLKIARTVPNAEAGVRWCTKCQHATISIAEARDGQVSKCSECQTAGPVQYLVYAPHVGRRIRELFVDQVKVIRWIARAERLGEEAKHDEAISMLTTAATFCQKTGNRAAAADVQCASGKAYSKAGDWPSALKSYREAGDWLTETQDYASLAKAEHGLGQAAFAAGLHRVAETHLLHALDATYQGDETPEELAERAAIFNALSLATLTCWDAGRTAIACAEQADLAHREVRRLLAERRSPVESPAETGFGKTFRKFFAQFPASPEEELKKAVEADGRGEPAVAVEHIRSARRALEGVGDAEPLLLFLNKQLLFLFKSGALVEAAQGCDHAETLARRLGRDDALSAALQNGAQLVEVLAQMKVEGYEGRELDAVRKKKEGDALGRLVEQRRKEEPGLRAEAGRKTSTDIAGAVDAFGRLAESLRARGAIREAADVVVAMATLRQQLGDAPRSLKDAVDAESLGRRARSPWIVSTALLLQGGALEALGHPETAAFRILRAAEGFAAILRRSPDEPPESPAPRTLVMGMFTSSVDAVRAGADEASRIARPRQAERLRERLAEIGGAFSPPSLHSIG